MNQATPVPQRDRLLMAYAVTEWSGALTHLSALRKVGCRVSPVIEEQVAGELLSFVMAWAKVSGLNGSTDATIAHAKAWVSQHIDELDKILKEVDMK